jgi:hypothetical protein
VGLWYLNRQTAANETQTGLFRTQYEDAKTGADQARRDTAAALAAAASQAESLRKLADANKTMSEAAKVNADNFARIARSSERSIDVTTGNFRHEQRPWIEVNLNHIDLGVITPDEPFSINIDFVNTGKSPALDVYFDSYATAAPAEPRLTWYDTIRSEVKALQKGQLSPGETRYVSVSAGGNEDVSHRPLPIDQATAEGLKSGTMRLWLHGVCEYSDQFGRRHSLRWCRVAQAGKGLVVCDDRQDVEIQP